MHPTQANAQSALPLAMLGLKAVETMGAQPLSIVEQMLEKRLEAQRTQLSAMTERLAEYERKSAAAYKAAEAAASREREREQQWASSQARVAELKFQLEAAQKKDARLKETHARELAECEAGAQKQLKAAISEAGKAHLEEASISAREFAEAKDRHRAREAELELRCTELERRAEAAEKSVAARDERYAQELARLKEEIATSSDEAATTKAVFQAEAAGLQQQLAEAAATCSALEDDLSARRAELEQERRGREADREAHEKATTQAAAKLRDEEEAHAAAERAHEVEVGLKAELQARDVFEPPAAGQVTAAGSVLARQEHARQHTEHVHPLPEAQAQHDELHEKLEAALKEKARREAELDEARKAHDKCEEEREQRQQLMQRTAAVGAAQLHDLQLLLSALAQNDPSSGQARLVAPPPGGAGGASPGGWPTPPMPRATI